jgi:hypothetical protein
MPFEPHRVDDVGFDAQQVARVASEEAVGLAGGLERAPHVGDVAVQALGGPRRRVVGPETVDQVRGRHDLVRPHREECEQHPLFRPAQKDRSERAGRFQWAEERELHR